MSYYSLNSYIQKRYGKKLYKLSLDGGFTCPNRDGTLGSRGCIFCSGRGSGDFAVPTGADIYEAIEQAKLKVAHKNKGGGYIAYFQSFTSTYAPVPRLRELFTAAIEHPDVEVLSIGTRPDCLGDDVLRLLKELNEIKPVWIELGLQTIHEDTAKYIRRGYELPVFDDAVKRLKAAGIEVIVHMIIGLPGETAEMIWDTARYIGKCGADGVKFQLLHILRGTDLLSDFEAGKFKALELEEYIHILEGCIQRIPENMVVHRITGDGDKKILVAPLWSGDKKKVLNTINKAFDEHHIIQGSKAPSDEGAVGAAD